MPRRAGFAGRSSVAATRATSRPALWPWLAIVRDLVDARARSPTRCWRPCSTASVTVRGRGAGTALRMYDAVAEPPRPGGSRTAALRRRPRGHPLGRRLVAAPADAGSVELGSARRARGDHSAYHRDARPASRWWRRWRRWRAAVASGYGSTGSTPPRCRGCCTTCLAPHDPRLDAVVDDGDRTATRSSCTSTPGCSRPRPDLSVGAIPRTLPVPDGVRDVLRLRLRPAAGQGAHVLVHRRRAGSDASTRTPSRRWPTSRSTTCSTCSTSGWRPGCSRSAALGYAFAHALTRETVYGEVSAARRMRLHARAATRARGACRRRPRRGRRDRAPRGDGRAARRGADRASRCVWLVPRGPGGADARQAHVEALDLWRRPGTTPRTARLDGQRLAGGAARPRPCCGSAGPPRPATSIDEIVEAGRALGRWDLVADAAAILTQGRRVELARARHQATRRSSTSSPRRSTTSTRCARPGCARRC